MVGIKFVEDREGYWHIYNNIPVARLVLHEVAKILGYNDVTAYLEASENRLAIRRRIKKAIRIALAKTKH